ncbi:MAG: hypothetical protein Q9227_004659 [Pyrenula ochraceoflavens]
MKILTKEEEQAHYRETLKGGIIGGVGGLAVGLAGVTFAQRRYPAFRSLTLPLKAFLVTSSGTFAGIISADHFSRGFESKTNAADQYYQEQQKKEAQARTQSMTLSERFMAGVREERYKIVGGSWVASMIAAFTLVGRNPYLTGQQKLVQARVYAQGLTLAVLVATAAFEISEQNADPSSSSSDPSDHEKPHHEENREGADMWKSMVEAEEERFKERDAYIKRKEVDDRKKGKQHHKKGQSPKHVETQSPDEVEEDEVPEKPLEGKRGEGKMMRKVSDKPGGAEGGVP